MEFSYGNYIRLNKDDIIIQKQLIVCIRAERKIGNFFWMERVTM